MLWSQIGPAQNGSASSTFDPFHYGNQWYQNNQAYFKLHVWEDGIYRVSLNDLQNAGVNLTGMVPSNLHIIYRGEEQAIHVETDSVGNLNYFEFYGRKNDGGVDSLLYRSPDTQHKPDPSQQPTPYTSIFSDTSAYFVTWNNTPGLRMQAVSSANYGNFTPEPWFRHRVVANYNNLFWRGGGSSTNPFFLLNSDYVTGEGYAGIAFQDGAEINRSIPTRGYANSGRPNKFRVRIMGSNTDYHPYLFEVQNNPIYTDNFFGISIKTMEYDTLVNLPNNTRLSVTAQMAGVQTSNAVVVNFFTIDYDRKFDLDGLNQITVFEWEDVDTARLSYTDIGISSEAWLWDLDGRHRVLGEESGTTAEFVLPGSAQKRNLYMVTDNGLKTPMIVPTTSLANLSNTQNDADFIIISHKKLKSSAEAYKAYRDTCTINPVKARVVFVDEIYDEFSYGTKTPLAIKRFCKYALDNWSTKPEYFFIWGKGMYLPRTNQNLIPTWGYPATDYEYVGNFFPEYEVKRIPEAAIGRVNVETNAEGFEYLKKVNEYEHLAYTGWMKEAVFLGGGKNFNEQTAISNSLLNTCLPIFEGPPSEGHVSYYMFKGNGQESNSPLTSEERINAGVGLIHFFGHSTANQFEVDIQEPENYQNDGRYPIIFGQGCYGGDFTGSQKSFGEKFVLIPGKGCVAYIANSTAGFLSELANYGQSLYQTGFGTQYGDRLGDVIQGTIGDYVMLPNGHTTNVFALNNAWQNNLQGDPALLMRFPEKPDLLIQKKNVVFQPSTLSAQDEEFQLDLVVQNQGATIVDSFDIRIRQRSPQGQIHDFPLIRRGPVDYADTFSVVLSNTFGDAFAGLNEFEIYVDVNDTVAEYYENNNSVTLRQLIQSNTPAILYPPEYALIPTQNVTLSASAYIITTATNFTYIFEIDTTEGFNSPMKNVSGPVAGTATYAEWDVPFTLTEGQVYYWRVRLAETNPPAWSTSSFRYKSGQSGWSQSQIPQFRKDILSTMKLDEINREWAFDPVVKKLIASIPLNGIATYKLEPYSNAANYPPLNFSGIYYTSFDAKTLESSVQGTIFGDWHWLLTPNALPTLTNEIQNTRNGDYFLIASHVNPKVNLWDSIHIRALEQIGCRYEQIRAMVDGDRMIIIGRKGDAPGTANVLIEPNSPVANGGIEWRLQKNLSGQSDNGTILSTDIGPSTGWQNLTFNWSSLDAIPREDLTVSVLGLKTDNTTDTLFTGLAQGASALNSIDATAYPNLRLLAQARDEQSFTAPQLNEWEVLYVEAPDAVIDPVTNVTMPKDTIDEGEIVPVNFQARNITTTNMDSLLVRFTLERADRTTINAGLIRYAPVPGKTAIDLPHDILTEGLGLVGNVTLIVEINPDNDQPELYQFNNIFRKTIYVNTDQTGPIMDVTFDGKHLIDGDIVSPTPEIQIMLSDENEHLALPVSDSTFKLWFGPGRALNLLPSIPVEGNANIEAIPGKLPENKSRVLFRPGLLDDGEYSLRVQGYDTKGNKAGKTEYVIHFNVVNEKAISQVLNYPNPFSTSTKFVYTLTGNELPYRFEIHIYTITGKLVKVIDLLETGDVRYGYNISETAWDGTDDFGDLLANGVYLYKAVVKFRDRADHKLRDEGVEEFFDNGWGKMYIMR